MDLYPGLLLYSVDLCVYFLCSVVEFEVRIVISLSLFLMFSIALVVHGHLLFHMNFQIGFIHYISGKDGTRILVGIGLSL